MGSSKPNPKKPGKPTPSKKAPAKPAAAKKPVPAGKGAASKAVPPAKKKPEPPKKPAPAPAKAKKDEKPAKGAAAKPAPVVKTAIPAKPAKAVPVAKAPAEKAPPKAAKVPKAPKKLPPAKGPMEKAQRSLAATAARAAAKDKVPPTKALAAVKEAQAKAAAARGAKPAAVAAPDAKVAAPRKPGKPFFQEVLPGAERIIKRGDKTTATPIPADLQNRRRAGGEESPEELVERIERELENQHIFKRNMLRPQLCTKCGINQVSERFTIDKELGYCDDCAEILHLGETKEARKIDFHPSLMKKDGEGAPEGEAEEEEEEDEEGPPAGPVPEVE